jgi:flagellar motility protein MotE (MotC chaperone)
VYYTSFPEGQTGWLGVIKTKARTIFQSLGNNTVETNDAYQDDDIQHVPIIVSNDDLQQSLVDIAAIAEDIGRISDTGEEEKEDEEEEEEFIDEDIAEEERLQENEDKNEDYFEETDSD